MFFGLFVYITLPKHLCVSPKVFQYKHQTLQLISWGTGDLGLALSPATPSCSPCQENKLFIQFSESAMLVHSGVLAYTNPLLRVMPC